MNRRFVQACPVESNQEGLRSEPIIDEFLELSYDRAVKHEEDNQRSRGE